MPSPSSRRSSRPSRRTVLATGSALGGTLLAGGLPAPAAAASSAPQGSDPWRTVLDDADLVWQRMPKTWYEGPYLGNGFLGSGIYAEPGAEADTFQAVRFNVQHSEVQDHRPQFGSLFGLARLPIGYLTLEPVGTITGLDWRLGLHDAELTGTLTTDRGTLTIRALVHNSRSVLAVEVTPSEGSATSRGSSTRRRRSARAPRSSRYLRGTRPTRRPRPGCTTASPPPCSRCSPAASTPPRGGSARGGVVGRCTCMSRTRIRSRRRSGARWPRCGTPRNSRTTRWR